MMVQALRRCSAAALVAAGRRGLAVGAHLLTVLASLQHALQVSEGSRLLRLRNGLFIILKHLVDIRLHINPVSVPWERLQGVDAVLKKRKKGSSQI